MEDRIIIRRHSIGGRKAVQVTGSEPPITLNLEHFDIHEIIGKGTIGTVYRALDRRSGMVVALKVVHEHLATNEAFRVRFLEQARAAARLAHEHVVRVYTAEYSDNLLILVMDDIPGMTLRAYLNDHLAKRTYIDLRHVVSIARQVAQALHAAHEIGLIHRDVKPEHVLLRERTGDKPPFALLTDFGIAQRIDGTQQLTGGVDILGTLAYMGPEQLRGEPLDGRYDVYSLGAVLYELITGQPPFPPESTTNLVLMQTQGEPIRLQDIRPSVPPALVSIVNLAMRKQPDERYDTALLMARELEALEKSIRPLEAETIRREIPLPARRSTVVARVVDATHMTRFDVIPMLDHPSLPVDLLGSVLDDTIIVNAPDGPARLFVLEKVSLLVGRDPACDLCLDDPRVSRRHLRIDRLPDGRISVTDLGSVNGSYLSDIKLGGNLTAVWSDGQSMLVGPYWLTLKLTRHPIGLGKRQLAFSAQTAVESRLGGSAASLRLSPVRSVVEPGNAVVVQVEVSNLTRAEQAYAISVIGLPDDWYTAPLVPLGVANNSRGERLLTFHPPRAPQVAPADYPYTVRVALLAQDTADSLQDELSGTLVVYPYLEFTSDISLRKSSLRVGVTNRGNTSRSYIVEVREPANKLVIAPGRLRIELAAAEQTELGIRIQAKRRKVVGITEALRLDVFVRSDGLPPQLHSLDYRVQPLVEWWVLAIGAILLVTTLLYVLSAAA